MRFLLLPALTFILIAAPVPVYSATDINGLPDWLAVHGQSTLVVQSVPDFSTPYSGTNSLTPNQTKETFDATLYVGVRPWQNGEIWINPEIDQGFGLSNTLGVAGFPSAEAYKVGKGHPYWRWARLFFRQTFNLGGETQTVESDQNQFAASNTANRIVLTLGKFGVADVFDTNKYAHDPRGDFLNWTIVDTGTFDYAADAWGYSTGMAAEWYQSDWTLRAGLFNLSKVANGETLETGFQQNQLDGEIEHRHRIGGHDGAIRLTVFSSRGNFGRYDDALALATATNTVPNVGLVLQRQTRTGVSLNIEQEVTDSVGVFLRAGTATGSIAPYDFTDIDRTIAVGTSISGRSWGREADTVGIAAVVNGISAEARRYLATGGLGILVGDGQLPDSGNESIGEMYYNWSMSKTVKLAFDYQFINNPGYNRDRGPINVFGLRLHGAF
jgi:high affinity Mn2+ porin